MFEAVTGQAVREIGELGQVYHRTTGQMSTDALKLAVQQEKLNKAIARYGPESTQAKQATIALRREIESTTSAVRQEEEALSRVGRARQMLASGSSRFSRAASFAGYGGGFGAAVAGSAVLYGLKSVVDASRDAQVVLGQTSVAVEDAGLSWAQYADRVSAAATRISKTSAFDDEKVLQSFAVFVRGQKDVGKSIELAGLAADVARGRYTDLESATQLVNKAALGQIGALRRAGIQIDKNASSTEALARLQEAYGGAAERYGRESAGAQDRLRVSIDNLKESLGSGLLPVLTEVTNNLTDGADAAGDLKQAFGELDRGTGGGGGSFFSALKGSPWGEMTAFVKVLKQGKPISFGDAPSDTLQTLNNIKAMKKALEETTVQAKAFSDAFGLGALTTSPGVTSRPDEGTRGVKPPPKKKRDGLTELQRLLVADATPGNELGDAKALLDYYRRQVDSGKLHGDKLFQAKIDLANQQARVQAILDGIAADKRAAAEKRRAAIEKQARDEAAARKREAEALERYHRQQVDAVKRSLETPRIAGPYANTHAGFANGGIAGKNAGVASKDSSGETNQEFLRQLTGQARAYASNVTVIQNFHSNTPAFAAAREHRRAAEAVYG